MPTAGAVGGREGDHRPRTSDLLDAATCGHLEAIGRACTERGLDLEITVGTYVDRKPDRPVAPSAVHVVADQYHGTPRDVLATLASQHG